MKWKSFHAAQTTCLGTAALGTEAKVMFKARNMNLRMKVMEPATDKPGEKRDCITSRKLKQSDGSDTGNESFQSQV